MKRKIFLFTLLGINLIIAQNNQKAIDAINKQLDEIWSDSNTPGLSLSVVFPDGEAVSFTKGMADIEKNLPMTSTTKMLGGSTGKVFYSVVVLQLIEEGKLELDTPIYSTMSDYDWFERLPNAKHLTVRALMRHETGIPRYVFKESFQKDILKDINKVWKPEELLSYVFDDKPEFEVGSDFAYSDTNYIILCMLIEEVTGNTLYDEVQSRVLDKVGLKHVVPQNKRRYDNIAQGYNAEDDGFFPGLQFDENGNSNYNLQFEWAGGGLVITSHDLAVLAKKIYEGEMFDPTLLDEYFKGRDAKQLRGQWGLGVHIQESPFGTVYGHSGFMPGYITNMMYFPEHKFAMCYQINTSDRSKTGAGRKIPMISKIIIDNLKP